MARSWDDGVTVGWPFFWLRPQPDHNPEVGLMVIIGDVVLSRAYLSQCCETKLPTGE